MSPAPIDFELLREGWEFEAKSAQGRDGRGAIPGSFWESYSAMANGHGGIICLGLRERRDRSFEIAGIADLDRVEQDLWNSLNNLQKVSANILVREDVECATADGRDVIVVHIPQADRRRRPLFINGNPLTGTYLRSGEGDRLARPDEVRRMLADADEQPPDAAIIEHFGLDDLDRESLKAYRNLFASQAPTHPFLAGDDLEFLHHLGAWGRDRASGRRGLTLAGLLMFGTQRSILDHLPHYQLDYQSWPGSPDDLDGRWDDRVTLDGTWSGNVFDFQRRIINKLYEGLASPFRLRADAVRADLTLQHEAL